MTIFYTLDPFLILSEKTIFPELLVEVHHFHQFFIGKGISHVLSDIWLWFQIFLSVIHSLFGDDDNEEDGGDTGSLFIYY